MKRVKTTEIVDIITKTILTTGAISLSILVPNTAQFVGKAFLKKSDKDEARSKVRNGLRYMKQQRYVTVTETADGTQIITLTEAGKQRYERRQFDTLQIQTPKHWDKKWRIVMFDIPEQHKAARNSLNWKLKQLGFKQLQRSVWVHPFPCLPEVELIKSTYGIEKFVTLLETESIDSHNKLVRQFSGLLT